MLLYSKTQLNTVLADLYRLRIIMMSDLPGPTSPRKLPEQIEASDSMNYYPSKVQGSVNFYGIRHILF